MEVCELVCDAEWGERGLELASVPAPYLILMDINLGGIDGIEATRRITADRDEVFVILVSTYPLEDLPVAARSCGARGYVNKDELSPRRIRALWESGGEPGWTTPGWSAGEW